MTKFSQILTYILTQKAMCHQPEDALIEFSETFNYVASLTLKYFSLLQITAKTRTD